MNDLPLAARRGHFLLASGHHGRLWLDLPLLCLHPDRLRPHAERLAGALGAHRVEVVCGPLVEGAFVALMVASALGVPFTYTDSEHHLPRPLRPAVAGRRVAIVDDVINAGAAARATLLALRDAGAEVVALGALLALGDAPAHLARDAGLPLETLAAWPNEIWPPAACPLCAAGVPLGAE